MNIQSSYYGSELVEALKLDEMQKTLAGFFDGACFIANKDGHLLTKPQNLCAFCKERFKNDKDGNASCDIFKSRLKDFFADKAAQNGKAVVSYCPRTGLCESFLPVSVAGHVFGVMCIGQVYTEKSDPTKINSLKESFCENSVSCNDDFTDPIFMKEKDFKKLVDFTLKMSSLIAQDASIKNPELSDYNQSKPVTEAAVFFKGLFDNKLLGVVVLDMIFDENGKPVDLLYVNVNDTHDKLTGLSKKDLVGNRYSKAVDKNVPYLDQFKRAVVNKESVTFEKRLEPINKTLRYNAFPLAGNRFAVVFDDVTERRQQTKELKEQHDRLASVIAATDIGTWERDFLTGKIILNDRWAEMLGYTLEELQPTTPETWENLLHPHDRAKVTNLAKQHFNNPDIAYEVEMRLKHKQGHWVWVYGSGEVTQRDKNGAPLRMFGIHLDITKNKAAENQILEQRDRLSNIIQSTNAGTWELNVQTNKAKVNESWAEMFGYSLEELQPVSFKTWEKLTHPGDLALSMERIEKHLQDPSIPYETEARIKHKDGHWVWIYGSGKVIKRDKNNAPLLMYGTNLDITALKQTEEKLKQTVRDLQDMAFKADQANYAKSEFVANLSHELRTPLNAIHGFAQMMDMQVFGELNERYSDYAKFIINSAELLLKLINELLDLSRIESGVQELDEENFSLCELISQTKDMILQYKNANKLDIQVTCDHGPLGVFADKQLIQQIMLNLLSNAIKFTEPGGHITLHATANNKNEPVISVTDDGIGLTEEARKKVLEPFYQVKNMLTKNHHGTGIGLTLVKKVTEMHGGNISIESTLGKGSTFTVTLPAERLVGSSSKPEARC